MKIIKTNVDEATFRRLVAKRKKKGLPSISAMFLQSAGELSDDVQAGEIVKAAVTSARKRKKGDEFRLRDLFDADDWEGFSKGARLRAGRLFSERISTDQGSLRPSRKSASNHQYYKKVTP